ncbi:AbrB/MazE/SpoVT family DNA-binding domain-containing protein [Sphingomonas montanisoli]|uniref:AbrB/MazE/SpoVT family DNA-binding domain-containing protein n=1 Tax=Sphingomonas montanisoli TaxID=2606412 RepID=A0A5D9C8V4_9SPHN|nr:AbrB/MazE/SpoVT family DNA-binding domain-containing protein [Sphingomonas montanisoli]TZG27480.1 AbrB/MazE/SpoVT family DNA-binding domain-containing protein [Sphingomonas montanisoli]
MAEEYRAKVFKSGNSVALRLPKGLGLKEGTEVLLREEHGEYRFEPIDKPKRKIDLTGIWGAIPDLKLIAPEDRLFEERELNWGPFDERD